MMPESDVYQRGLEFYQQMFGDGSGDLDDLGLPEGDPFREEMITWCYGNLMQDRGVLSDKVRALTAVGMLTVLAKDDLTFRDWVRGSINLGCTPKEVRETIITMHIYAGFPVVRRGLELAREVFDEMGV